MNLEPLKNKGICSACVEDWGINSCPDKECIWVKEHGGSKGWFEKESIASAVEWLKQKLKCKNCDHIHSEPNWCMAFEDTCTCENEQNATKGMMTEAIIDEAFADVVEEQK